MRITSTANPRIKAAAELKERKGRERTGLFLIEGAREIERALAAGLEVIEAYCGERLSPEEARTVADLSRGLGLEVHELSDAALKKISSREHPAGVVVVARMPRPSLATFHPPKTPCCWSRWGWKNLATWGPCCARPTPPGPMRYWWRVG